MIMQTILIAFQKTRNWAIAYFAKNQLLRMIIWPRSIRNEIYRKRK